MTRSILQRICRPWTRTRLTRGVQGRHRYFSANPKLVSPTTAATNNKESFFSRPPIRNDPFTNTKGLTIGILRETYDAWERRTPLCPHHVKLLLTQNKGLSKVLVQPSSQRCFSNNDYEQAGATLSDDLHQADIIFGVKRPKDPETLLDNKTYVFFSHVIKGQQSNMALLQRVLDKHIQLIDYECIVEEQRIGNRIRSNRVVAFGKFAGLAGMLDTFYPLGRRLVTDHGVHTPFLQCPLASMQPGLEHAQKTIRTVGEQIASDGLPEDLNEPLVFCVTGQGGRVFGGAMEILDLLPREHIQAHELPELFAQSNPDRYKVFVVTPAPKDLYYRRSDGSFEADDWRNHPSEYESRFATSIAPYSHVLVNCIYWDPRYARLLTKDEAQELHEHGRNRLIVVSDISCDINGSIEFLDRTCTIAQPFFQYNPLTRQEDCADIGDKGITVMGTDILPAELPKESSDHFGSAVVSVLDRLFETQQQSGNDGSQTKLSMDLQNGPPLLSDACITTSQGVLAPRFRYLDSFLHHIQPSNVPEKAHHVDVLLNGHLFDSGLINAILDTAEHLQCGFQIINCRVDRGGHAKDLVPTEKSTALVQFYGNNQADLESLEAKIRTLTEVMSKAEATMKVVDRSFSKLAKDVSTGGSGSGGGRPIQATRSAVVESQEEQRVLVLGSGRVSKSLVDWLGRTAQKTIHVASDNEEEAKAVAKVAERGTHTVLDLKNPSGLESLLKGKDVVISLLPAPMHPTVAEECIRQKVSLVTASYESPAMKALNERAKAAGIVILNEVGLDPGLDHMSVMKIIDDVTARGGTIDNFQSVCGGLPAPEAANNCLKYKFSWSPKGVISASQNSARYRWQNGIIEVDGKDLMRSALPFTHVWPELGLECLPNRDSLKYESIYGIEKATTLFRGTLRYQGFSSLMSVFQRMGLFQDIPAGAVSWGDTVKRLQTGRSMDDFLLDCASGDAERADAAKAALVEWNMMDGSSPVAHPNSLVDSFCVVLEEHLKFEESERDMVVMHTVIDASFNDGPTEVHQSSLLVFGDESMSAMCRTVGFPTAAAADLVLSGVLKNDTGLLLPSDPRIYNPILAALAKEGIVFEESVTTK